MNRFLVAAVLIATVLHPQVFAAPVPLSKPIADSREELEQAWDMVGWYRPYAVKFWCRIQANPREGYAFFDRVIEPIELSEVKAKRLLDDLGSDDDKVWRAATARLRKRDIRLAMNFLDAWDYAKTDLQRRRLSSVVYLDLEFPDYYDVTLTKVVPFPGVRDTHFLKMTLNPNTPKELQQQLGLHPGTGTGLDPKRMQTPESWRSAPESTLIRYLERSRRPASDALIDRLATGHSDDDTTKSARASVKARSLRHYRQLRESLSPDTLPVLWHEWGYPSSPDQLTAKMLADPEMALAFLRREMKPVRPTAIGCGLLLSFLPHPSDEVWDRACEQLQRSDPRFCLSVEQLWQLAKTPEQRRRMARVFWPDFRDVGYLEFDLIREGYGNRKYWMMESRVRKDIVPDKLPAHLNLQR